MQVAFLGEIYFTKAETRTDISFGKASYNNNNRINNNRLNRCTVAATRKWRHNCTIDKPQAAICVPPALAILFSACD